MADNVQLQKQLNALQKLQGASNYAVLRVQIKSTLEATGLWDYVDGTEVSLVKGQPGPTESGLEIAKETEVHSREGTRNGDNAMLEHVLHY